MALYDIRDGNFSILLAEASKAMAADDPYHAFGVLRSMAEAREVASFVRGDIVFCGEKSATEWRRRLLERFLPEAEILFHRRWGQAEGSFERVIGRKCEAIRILTVAMEMADSPEDKRRLGLLFDSHVKRLISFGRTVRSAEKEAEGLWEREEIAAAIEVLQAALAYRETAQLSGGTGNAKKLLGQLSTIYSRELADRALLESGSDLDKAEEMAVRAAKVQIVGGCRDRNVARVLRRICIDAMKRRLDRIEENAGLSPSGGSVEDRGGLHRADFWFVPKDLLERYRNLRGRLLSACVLDRLDASRNKILLSDKIATLKKSAESLRDWPLPRNPLQERLRELSAIRRQLQDLARNAKGLRESKRHSEILASSYFALGLVHQFSDPENEALADPALDLLERLRDESRDALDMAARAMENARKAWTPFDKLANCLHALRYDPACAEALETKSRMESFLSLSGDSIRIVAGDSNVLWFAKSSIRICRNGGDLSLNLESLSESPKYVELSLERDRVHLFARQATNWVCTKTDKPNPDLYMRDAAYMKVPWDHSVALDDEGELLLGFIGRFQWKRSGDFLQLRPLPPYSPSDYYGKPVDKSTDDLWPDWKEIVRETVVVSPRRIALDSSGAFPADDESERRSRIVVEKAGENFRIFSPKSPLRVAGIPMDSGPALSQVEYEFEGARFMFR